MRRRTLLKTLAGAAAVPVVAGCGKAASSGTKAYSLTFDTSAYTTKTKSVDTGSGTRTVKYRFYRNNVYVQHPVNYKYQSLNVSVPVEIDGQAVDATSAPVMFAINVGGYTSSSSWGATAQGGGMSAGGAAGGFGSPGSGGRSGSGGAPGGGASGGSGSGGSGGSGG